MSKTESPVVRYYRPRVPDERSMRLSFEQEVSQECPVKLEHIRNEKAFLVKNVENITLLSIQSPNLHFQVTHTANPQEFRVNYFPKGDEHLVHVTYEDKKVDGAPFSLLPRPPRIEFDHSNKKFTVFNIHDPDKLEIRSSSLEYQMFRDREDSTTYHIEYTIDRQTIHDVDVFYKEKHVPQGSFRLVPRELRESYEQEHRVATSSTINRGQLIMSHEVEGGSDEILWSHDPETPVVTTRNHHAYTRNRDQTNDVQENLGRLLMTHQAANRPRESHRCSNRFRLESFGPLSHSISILSDQEFSQPSPLHTPPRIYGGSYY